MADMSSRRTWSNVRWPASLLSAPLHIPAEWAQAAEHVCRQVTRRALVLGARDVGKSTFCRFLADASLQASRGTALLDTDVGQKMIGPPACVTMSDAHGLSLAFVGTTNPVLGWRRLIDGMHRLVERTDVDFLIVNTSGLLAGPGQRLKAAKIDELRPDLLIVLGEDPVLEAIAGDRPALPVLRLPSSPGARRKTDGERRAARREAFRIYFAGATILRLERRMVQSMEADAALPAGLLVGLSDERTDLGLGLVVDSNDATLEVLSPVAGNGIRRIVPGLLRLDEHFSEMPAPGRPRGS
jgi:polynucleotide 5'-hydroxyl-kinase GRC3/NOL9